MNRQTVLFTENYKNQLDEYLAKLNVKRILLVCGSSIQNLNIGHYFEQLGNTNKIAVQHFTNFQPNPLYDSVEKGVKVFRKFQCDFIAAVGGGSAIDVAKCIKLYANMDDTKSYLEQRIVPNKIPLLAVPTTAGTGSEATKYAVIYQNGVKVSITDSSCIPSVVLLDPSVLTTLPQYQKKATMCDALCHAMESFWSVHSTEESRNFSEQALSLILNNWKLYLDNNEIGNRNMLLAAHLAGKAINIAQTTAGHAMCYQLTSLYGIAHGHGAALCVGSLWPIMLQNMDKCVDPRGVEYVKKSFDKLARAMGCSSVEAAINQFQKMLDRLELTMPEKITNDNLKLLITSVNPERLRNTPVQLDLNMIGKIYQNLSG